MSFYHKSNITQDEIFFHTRALSLGIAPAICDVGRNWVKMEHLNAHCLADKFGENPHDIPDAQWKQIHILIRRLFYQGNMEYIDITPYNFIEKNGVVWCIDYGHVKEREGDIPKNWFLRDFIENDAMKEWNPDFA